MADAEPEIHPQRRISRIWLIPIVALVLAIWMVIYTLRSQGPEITIVFSDADGIEAGTTKIKALSLEVGRVESARLSDDQKQISITARLQPGAEPLLREDTQFWVVRPRIGSSGVSGLGTLLSGSYIQLSPGTGNPGRRGFTGFDVPPATPIGTPGLHFEILSSRVSAVGRGDPILYEGFPIGRIESAEFDLTRRKARYAAFIEARYEELVSTSTRFWNASGISLSASANGVELRSESLQTLLGGGVALGLPDGIAPGDRVTDGAVFELFPDLASAADRGYLYSIEYVVKFSRSVRGLKPGAPVEFRGIRVGEVERILLEDFAAGVRGEADDSIPVLIRIQPGPQGLPDTKEGTEKLRTTIRSAVENGMRVTLESGNLLTGSLYLAANFYPDAPAAKIGEYAGRPTLPVIDTGFAEIQTKLSAALDKVNDLPVEETIRRVNQSLAALNGILDSKATQSLPSSLDLTLVELRNSLSSVSEDSELQRNLRDVIVNLDETLITLKAVLSTLEEQPNALIFNRKPKADPMPSPRAR